MRVLFVYQGFEESRALGARVRRAGLRSAFGQHGAECVELVLPRRRWAPAEVLSVGGIVPSLRSQLFFLAKENDAILLEGLPTAVACIRGLRKRTRGKIHVDICDSWMRLSGVGGGAGGSSRAMLVRKVKRVIAGVALRYVSRYADSISYISTLDLASDEQHLSRKVRSFLVPNGNPVATTSQDIEWNSGGPMVMVGDWSYPPNRQMLNSVLAWYSRLASRPRLNVVGPNLNRIGEVPSDVNVVGWVQELSLAYNGVSCALALTESGSGIKNKVLEPLSFGIPVIATEDALNGILYDSAMVLVFRPGLTGEDVSGWLFALAEAGVTKLQAPSWEQNTEELVRYLMNGSRL